MADLGEQPLANELPDTREESLEQARFPLHARVCDRCRLVQIDDVVAPSRLFGTYTYFSSFSDSALRHADESAASMVASLGLGPTDLVVEIASNDGYLLRAFRDHDVPVLGVEPAANVAAAAEAAGVPTVVGFFGRELAKELRAEHAPPALVIANNVWAHVPDLRDFTDGLATLAGDDGLVSIEVPHLLRLLEHVAFDTIYHEHHSYFSLLSAITVLSSAELDLVDVLELPTHGGSLRLLARRDAKPTADGAARIQRILATERDAGLETGDVYDAFAARVATTVDGLRAFLDDAASSGDDVAAYGAAAKGTVLLNAVAATDGDVRVVADRSPHKVGRFVPGCGIPIVATPDLLASKPRHVLILPWNLVDEIAAELSAVRSWGGDLVTAVPEIRVHA